MKRNAERWRLIDSGAADGPSNMALDEALFASFDPEKSLPLLRMYTWKPAALSLGRYQDAAGDLDLARCAAEGVAVVRRMTGGGIIYHGDELTYSIVCTPEQLGERCGVKDGYRRLCGFLLGAYRSLGLPAAFAIDREAEGAYGARTAFCFAGREAYDVVVHGKKLGGNAQRRTRRLIFQHGSIPLRSNVAEAQRFLKAPAPEAEQATSLEELGLAPSVADLKGALLTGFAGSMGVELHLDEVTEAEREGARQLLEAKYGCSRWNIESEV